MKSTVLGLLKKHGVDKDTVARWEKKCTPGMTQQFERLMAEVKELDQIMGPLNPSTPTKSKPQTEKHSSGKRFSFGDGSTSKSKTSIEGESNKMKS